MNNTTTPFAGHPRPQPHPQSVVAEVEDLSRQLAQKMREERNRLEKAWYNGLMAMKGQYPRFFNGRVTINDEKDESGVYALAYQTAEAAAGHVNSREDTQVVIFADAAMVPTRQTNTSAGVGVAFRRHDPMVADAPDGMVSVWVAWPVRTEDEPLNSTGAEILALSYGLHVAMVELYRLEARLVAEEKKRQEEKDERRAARRQAKHHRRAPERARRRARDRLTKSKAQRRQEKAARKKMRAEGRKLRQQKRAERLRKRRTKVTVKLFTDSAAALLLLDGQLPITADSGLRMPAVEAIRQSMELKRRFVNRAEASAVMDVSLELHWVPGHGRSGGEASRRLHKKADQEATKARDMASTNPDNWRRRRGSFWRSPAELADLNGDLPECDEPPVTFALEHC
ncbi:hypothetical protein B0T20DRAFT_389287 [Sordaria brevicollis]|uniref:Uncharacterized protein n=1 Tax=Sordaria brevicollis TaxID=83679 RepID=A0AAE0PJT3_SORBR|nr:hypothetical protein B0T20DRAFT_389287 [Sordaria brevicollis]